ncbi:IS1595 family transposase [Microbulbifer sp. OS29]|uniref:IS1595 family transposase n=2 Tax=Microbulbifer okhotskensis TaxID=2926617 RepID=A0A9X2J6K3_9GAMM|nr:IS1595 family transposase [Microbulbifer okhotskensis]
MGLNVSNRQISLELGVSEKTAQTMTEQMRTEIKNNRPKTTLSGEVEFDEVYVVSGHKGHPASVKKGRKPRRRRLKGARGRGTLEKEKPPILGMIQRGGEVVIRMLENVQQKTIRPIIEKYVAKGTTTYTDEYDIYSQLNNWGYERHSVCHSAGEYARDDDGDGFCEVHVNTMEGFWSLLRSWLRPHRGISQEKLPAYLAFFRGGTQYQKMGAWIT